jgi:thiamine kinase-like enzyme
MTISAELPSSEAGSSREKAQDPRMLAFASALHPRGVVNRVGFANGQPDGRASRARADVIVLSLAPRMKRDVSVLDAIVEYAVANVAPDGVVYVTGRPTLRNLALRLLRRRGYTEGETIVQLKSGAARFYVPLSARSLGFATRNWAIARRWRVLAALLRSLPTASRLLKAMLPMAGVAARLPGATEFAWLLSRLGDARSCEAIVATSWRESGGSSIVFAFGPGDGSPALIAKRPSEQKFATILHEATMLNEVARTAEAAGVTVPRLVQLLEERMQPCLLETGVPGRPASEILKRRPQALRPLLDRMAAWLQSWHCSTVHRAPLTGADCEETVLAPARSIVEHIAGGEDYYLWLQNATAELIGVDVPWVSSHNDLSMVNVLLRGNGDLSVVDWETASARGLPLADFWYAACDAATCGKPRTRAAVFEQAFLKEGDLKDAMAVHEGRLREAIGGPDKWLRLCFHACWLQHAENDRTQRLAGRPSSFLAIANRLPSFTSES